MLHIASWSAGYEKLEPATLWQPSLNPKSQVLNSNTQRVALHRTTLLRASLEVGSRQGLCFHERAQGLYEFQGIRGLKGF